MKRKTQSKTFQKVVFFPPIFSDQNVFYYVLGLGKNRKNVIQNHLFLCFVCSVNTLKMNEK